MYVKKCTFEKKIEGRSVISAVGKIGSCRNKSMKRFDPQKMVSFAAKKWNSFLGSWHPSL